MQTSLLSLYSSLAERAQAVKSWPDLTLWVRQHVRTYIPHEKTVLSLGRIVGPAVMVDAFRAIDMSPAFVQSITMHFKRSERQVVRHWLHRLSPVILRSSGAPFTISPVELAECQMEGITSMLAHGTMDHVGQSCSYFSLINFDESLSDDDLRLRLELLAPILHTTVGRLQRIQQQQRKPDAGPRLDTVLSPRELLVLAWICAGCSDKEIAFKLQRSTSTIKHQVSSILKKLGVASRTEVATASSKRGLIQIQEVERQPPTADR